MSAQARTGTTRAHLVLSLDCLETCTTLAHTSVLHHQGSVGREGLLEDQSKKALRWYKVTSKITALG